MKTKTIDRIGLVSTFMLRTLGPVAWGLGFAEMSWTTRGFWAGAALLWAIQDLASTLAFRAKKEAEREHPKEVEVGMHKIPLDSEEGRAFAQLIGKLEGKTDDPPEGPTN